MHRRRQRGFNWVEGLQGVVNSINSQPKEVLSYQTPFTVYFGRGFDKSADEIRKKAKQASLKCNKRLHTAQMRRCPCTIYEKGARILVRYPFGKRVPYKRYVLQGKVMKRSQDLSRYKVRFRTEDGSILNEWVSVEHITSRTLQEERERRTRSYQKFKEREKRRMHRQRFYIPLESDAFENEERERSARLRMKKQERERRRIHRQRFYIPVERRENDSLFANNADIRIVDDPSEASNCQFDSVSHQIIKAGIYRTGDQLRQIAVNHMKENKDHYRDFTTGSIDTYLKRMSDTNTFGDNLTLLALARELNCQFVVVNSRGRSYNRLVSNTGVYSEEMSTFTLGFYPEIHYVSVEITNGNILTGIIDGLRVPNVPERISEPGDDTRTDTDSPGAGVLENERIGCGDLNCDGEEFSIRDNIDDVSDSHNSNDWKNNNLIGNNGADDNSDIEKSNEEEGGSNIDSVNDDDDESYVDEMGSVINDVPGNDEIADENNDDLIGNNGTDENSDDDNNNEEEEGSIIGGNNTDNNESYEDVMGSIIDVGPDNDEGGDGDIPILPYLILRRIIFFSITNSPLMRYTLQRVSGPFADIIRELGYPRAYLRPNQTLSLPLHTYTELSVVRLSRMYGRHGGLMVNVRNLLSESGARWFRAWLTFYSLGFGWFDIVDVRWR